MNIQSAIEEYGFSLDISVCNIWDRIRQEKTVMNTPRLYGLAECLWRRKEVHDELCFLARLSREL